MSTDYWRRYQRSPKRIDPTVAYVFPRPLGGGVILGGSRDENNWSDEWDEELGKTIMQRCCELCPELGRPEDLQIVSKNIGLRRKFIGSGSWEVELTLHSVANRGTEDRSGEGEVARSRGTLLWAFWRGVSEFLVSCKLLLKG